MKLQLIEEWRQCWRWFSTWALTLAGAIPAVWAELPPDLKFVIPASLMGTITAVVAVCGIVGRVINQTKSGETS
ncbi:hypothetical protein [Gibbsiella quercinecans]|uniref:DUF7940 domain-containing protein n=1 Tax=Gibbsiella quercinecans TaxID=929813 RepID=UPI0024305FB3|nr:hypothetical protein [Gibbsiella quercinecans]